MSLRKSPPHGRARSRISVVLADDHPIVREGVRCVLERQPDISVVAAVGDGSAVVREVERFSPRIVIMGISMPGLNGIEATKLIADKQPGAEVIILSTHSSSIIVRRAMEAGARGYLPKDASADELVRAVRTVVDGKRYVGQGLAQSLLEVRKDDRMGDRATPALTATERNILKLVSEGSSNPEIAAIIGLSPRTVETYRLRLMRKLQIENLPALVKFAIRQGITTLD